MTLIVETGEGTSGANSYVGLSYATDYLSARNKATGWLAASLTARKAALIEATTYIDLTFGHRFMGSREYNDMEFFAKQFISLNVQPTVNDTITIGTQEYTLTDTVASADDVLIGASMAATLQNLIYAVNASGGTAGVEYGTGTTANADVTASLGEGTTVLLTAKVSGVDGNSIAVSGSAAFNIDGATLSGGKGVGVQPLEFPREHLYDRDGYPVDGIPERLKMATVEYADRQLVAALLPDPTYDESGRVITRKLEKVGPIEEEVEYVAAALVITRKYPLADRMIQSFMAGQGGGTYR